MSMPLLWEKEQSGKIMWIYIFFWRTKELFGTEFAEKVFKMQLSYFENINYDEEVTFLIENPPTEKEIKEFLVEASISDLPKL